MPHSGKQCRRKLNLNFAVLLMRSTYEAVDALDFVAMDKFQVAFWKLRQSQFEVYKNSLDPVPVPVGDLSASSYFDFIAFAQYATISNIIPDAPQMFEVSQHLPHSFISTLVACTAKAHARWSTACVRHSSYKIVAPACGCPARMLYCCMLANFATAAS